MIDSVEQPPVENRWKFVKATDSRGNPIEGLWIRNKRFYYQTHIPGKGTRRIPLLNDGRQPVANLAEAREAIAQFKRDKGEGKLPAPRHAPLLEDFVKHYITWLQETDAKHLLTIAKEEGTLKLWLAGLGNIRISQITLPMIKRYALKRKQEGKNSRTVNLDVIALNNLLKSAKDDGWLKGDLATKGWEPLKWQAPRRTLITPEDIDKLCAEALRQEGGKPVYQMGRQLADWLRFMAFSGARRQAALTATWKGVDMANRQLHLDTKYDKHVVVDFNPGLEAHLKDMATRRLPEEEDVISWMFPSPRSDGFEGHLTNMHKTLSMVRERVGMKDFTPHDLRHHFISYAVMDGVDFMTIARWVGHSDGGILIGKVYGHLSQGHMQRSADRLTFGATPATPAAPAPMTGQIDLTKVTAADFLKLVQQAQESAGNPSPPVQKTASPPVPLQTPSQNG